MAGLRLSILDVLITITCEDPVALSLLRKKFGSMCGDDGRFLLRYIIRRQDQNHIEFLREEAEIIATENDQDFLYQFEKDLTIKLEEIRSDLFFVHGAALEYRERGCVIVAESGSGKSTATWALLHHGFSYLSDELSPIDIHETDVQLHPFPQAICLKQEPPELYPLGDSVLKIGSVFHIETGRLPAQIVLDPIPLSTLFFLTKYKTEERSHFVREISTAEAAARLYSNSLNALAHPHMGLDAAIRICGMCRCFEAGGRDLARTVRKMQSLMTC